MFIIFRLSLSLPRLQFGTPCVLCRVFSSGCIPGSPPLTPPPRTSVQSKLRSSGCLRPRLDVKPAAGSRHGHPVIDWRAANLEKTRGGDSHKDRTALQKVAHDVRAQTHYNLLPEVTAVDVGSTLGYIPLEFQMVRIPLLQSQGLQIIAVCQDIFLSFSFQAVQNKGQEFGQGANL